MNIPHVPNTLIEYLDDAYPLRAPTLSSTEREIWIAVGKHELIENLRAIHAAQEAGDDSQEGLPNVLPHRAGSGPADAADTSPGSSSATAARTSGSSGNRLGS